LGDGGSRPEGGVQKKKEKKRRYRGSFTATKAHGKPKGIREKFITYLHIWGNGAGMAGRVARKDMYTREGGGGECGKGGGIQYFLEKTT